jgi:deazaflavin-dependent oxidoreductase (nitroreductase family)
VGLATRLSVPPRRPNVVQRLSQSFGSTRAGAWFFSKTVSPVDRALFRMSKGRWTVPRLLAGLPVIMVTTTGRRTGRPRAVPLVAVPTGDDLAIIGTNFGQRNTPAWVVNLEADPKATAAYRDRIVDVVARPATEEERTSIFSTAAVIYPGYDKYQERITGRSIRIFVLEAP